MRRTFRQLKLDGILDKMTIEAQERAAIAAFSMDGHDRVLTPTSIRMNLRTLTYFDVLAQTMRVSRNAVIQAVLEHLVEQANPADRDQQT